MSSTSVWGLHAARGSNTSLTMRHPDVPFCMVMSFLWSGDSVWHYRRYHVIFKPNNAVSNFDFHDSTLSFPEKPNHSHTHYISVMTSQIPSKLAIRSTACSGQQHQWKIKALHHWPYLTEFIESSVNSSGKIMRKAFTWHDMSILK